MTIMQINSLNNLMTLDNKINWIQMCLNLYTLFDYLGVDSGSKRRDESLQFSPIFSNSMKLLYI